MRLQPRKQLIFILLRRIAIFFFCLFRPRIPRRGLRRDSSYPGFWSFSVDLLFLVPEYKGAGPDSFSCMYSEFHKPNFPDSGIRIPLHADDLLNMFPCFFAVTFVSQKTWPNNFRKLFEIISSQRRFTLHNLVELRRLNYSMISRQSRPARLM